jgi:outer membrane receptor protein involved in Fe transport
MAALIAQVNNIFDTQYYTAAQLKATGFTSAEISLRGRFRQVAGQFPVQQATFYAPGAPTTYWVGTRVKF